MPNSRNLAFVLLIGAIFFPIVGAFARAAGWIGARRGSGEDIIAALEYNGGVHTGYRRAQREPR